MRLFLLGTGSLFEKLFTILPDAGINIVAALNSNPESRFAEYCHLPTIRWLHSIDDLADDEVDLCFMCDYLRLLPAEFVKKYKVLNSHGGLLPKYRGYHGNGWAFINGETEIGYTIHRVDSSLDGGPIIYQKKFSVNPTSTFSEIKSKITWDIEQNLANVLNDYFKGKLKEQPQNAQKATFVARRHIRDCYIEWERSSVEIERFIRALAPPFAPGAFTVFRNQKLVILSAELFETEIYSEIPGHVVYRIEGQGILVKTGDGVLLMKEVEYQGKKIHSLDLFSTTGYRLGLDLVGEKLSQLGIY
ncbi:hypothetical protein H6G06_24150 [Anabaena sphaerica FACHB-251]|uniref:Methionyl-tRNA formyltransferase n=1 Tax=Anabaena sphaerica FACHB-251 TaxID=2692883 RepID=A0A927A3H5_9NOST|nr:formyltransferase family protein [Anabaena sphaerica]MBD2296483.1 hypothetical protein [Anabaena sphaerica FACHB-251]